MNIVESISGEGVKTTTKPFVHERFKTPKPGDVIDFGEFEGQYPFASGQLGRVSEIYPQGICSKPGEIHICCRGCSVFLFDSGSVSISGGPFQMLKLENLEATYTAKVVKFWNWGDNRPGAGKGVNYWIERPVFKIISED